MNNAAPKLELRAPQRGELYEFFLRIYESNAPWFYSYNKSDLGWNYPDDVDCKVGADGHVYVRSDKFRPNELIPEGRLDFKGIRLSPAYAKEALVEYENITYYRLPR